LDPGRHFFSADDIDWVRAIDTRDQRKLTLGIVGDVATLIELGPFAAGLAHEVDREVRDDSVEPGEKGRAAFECREAFVDSKEGLLHDLARVVFVTHEADGDRKCAALMPIDQAPECGLVSGLSSSDESTIFLGFP
jgi:hypothetical protein